MNRFRRCLVCLLFLVACSSLIAQDADAGKKAPTEADKRVKELLVEANDLQGRKRLVDALSKVSEAMQLAPENPETYNVRGSIYLSAQLRDFDKARADFNKAQELAPGAIPPMFNLAELNFVAGKFADSEKGFEALMPHFDRLPVSMRHLLRFKIFICKVKQKQRTEAEAYLKEHFTFLDDTPAYYFAKAVLAKEDKNDRATNEWLAKAQVIFKKPDNEPFLDSMLETQYIHSVDIPAVDAPEESSDSGK
jgi:tetratricopeptide (TPR) repeat protein